MVSMAGATMASAPPRPRIRGGGGGVVGITARGATGLSNKGAPRGGASPRAPRAGATSLRKGRAGRVVRGQVSARWLFFGMEVVETLRANDGGRRRRGGQLTAGGVVRAEVANAAETAAEPSPVERDPVEVLSSSEVTEGEGLVLLDWPLICAQVAAFASTAAGNVACTRGMPIGSSYEESLQLLAQTQAAQDCELSFDGVYDVRRHVEWASAGRVLTGSALVEIASTLQTAMRLKDTLQGHKGNVGALLDTTCGALESAPASVHETIMECLGAGGLVLDSASDELREVRELRRMNLQDLQGTLNRLVQQLYKAGGAETRQLVSRRGRQCIPVRRGQQGLLPNGGVVLGESNTGSTLFMEPKEVMPLNNTEAVLAAEEEAAVQTILMELSNVVAVEAKSIIDVLEAITTLDLASARAAHASWCGGICPDLVPPEVDRQMCIESILNPVLLQPALPPLPDTWEVEESAESTETYTIVSKRQQRRERQASRSQRGQGGGGDGSGDSDGEDEPRAAKPVAVGFPIPEGTRVVAITGPNTGGKTASLKTLGLAAIMAKAGLFLPTSSPAQLSWFDRVLVDLGDSQSLEQSLSTFSGHIRRLRNILAAMTPRSLVLLDEVGSGTDPTEGAALAVSLLTRFAEEARLTFATTHYAELKTIARADQRFATAAVGFDTAALRPTYELQWGEVGESNALDIARGLGLPTPIYNAARELMEQEVTHARTAEQTGALMGSLNNQLAEQQIRTKRMVAKKAELVAELESMRNESLNLVDNFEELCEQYRLEAEIKREIALKQVEQAVAASASDNERKNQIDAAVRAFATQMGHKSNVADEEEGEAWVPKVGDFVKVNRLGKKEAQVVALNDGPVPQITVKMGRMEMRVELDEIEKSEKRAPKPTAAVKTQRSDAKQTKATAGANQNSDTLKAAVQFDSNTCDLRGMRVEEGLSELETYINKRGGGHGYIFVVHGVGTGQMKKAVLETLKSHPMITNFEPNEGPGGDGCTVAYVQ